MWYNVLIMSILHTKTLRNLSKLRKAQTLVQMQGMADSMSCTLYFLIVIIPLNALKFHLLPRAIPLAISISQPSPQVQPGASVVLSLHPAICLHTASGLARHCTNSVQGGNRRDADCQAIHR